jgi:Arc/MetJ-type ribon-helix-helix transcriptional regulator
MKQIALRLPVEMLRRLDDLVEARLDRPDRTAVIRELLAEGLDAREKKARR